MKAAFTQYMIRPISGCGGSDHQSKYSGGHQIFSGRGKEVDISIIDYKNRTYKLIIERLWIIKLFIHRRTRQDILSTKHPN